MRSGIKGNAVLNGMQLRALREGRYWGNAVNEGAVYIGGFS